LAPTPLTRTSRARSIETDSLMTGTSAFYSDLSATTGKTGKSYSCRGDRAVNATRSLSYFSADSPGLTLSQSAEDNDSRAPSFSPSKFHTQTATPRDVRLNPTTQETARSPRSKSASPRTRSERAASPRTTSRKPASQRARDAMALRSDRATAPSCKPAATSSSCKPSLIVQPTASGNQKISVSGPSDGTLALSLEVSPAKGRRIVS